MMQRLGDYIRPVDVRNRDLKVERLMGINIEKKFMPSVANVIGTDLSNYKVVSKNQFACNLMHVGRDEKIPVAIQNEDDPIIVSPAYVVFEVNDTKVLDPEYLMMWFSRSEFDRNAWFYTDGDVRGGMDREALFDMTIPVPDIKEQRNIVAEYKALQRRIETNKKLIETLEQTAQILYRKTFIDNIDLNLLPNGWHKGNLYELCDNISGGDWGKDEPTGCYISEVFCIRGTDIPFVSKGIKSTMPIRYILQKNLDSRKLNAENIVVEISGGTPKQSTGRALFVLNRLKKYMSKELICSNFCKCIVGKVHYNYFIYATLKDFYNRRLMFKYENSSNGINNLDLESLLIEEDVFIPSLDDVLRFSENYKAILNRILLYGRDIEYVTQMQTLLLSKMGV